MTKLQKQTMRNRVVALMDLHGIIAIAEAQIQRAKNIPILDDAEHADWVQGYTERIHDIFIDMSELAGFGHRNGGAE